MSFIPSNVRELPIGVPYIDEDAETDSIKVKSGFCTKCRDALLCVNRGPGTRDEVLAGRKATRKQYYTRTSAMQFAAGAGCKLCILFLTTLETISSTSFRDWTDPVGGLIWVYHAERKNEKWIYAHLGIDVELEEAEDWRMERVRVVWWRTHDNVRMLSNSKPNHDIEVLPLVAKWLDTCGAHHKGCENITRILPSRLVSITGSDPQLVMTVDLPTDIEYATLSHCWGLSKYGTLKQDNIADFQTRIPDDALSRTFVDSFTVARFLGINYIWIDSLCIIQDSKSDWLQESVRMCHVYSNSILNIAASKAKDGSEGFLSHRTPEDRHLFFDIQELRNGDRNRAYCMYDPFLELVGSCPLGKRGWVLQERILAPRTVHFMAGHIFWECNVSDACCRVPKRSESLPTGMAEYETYQFSPVKHRGGLDQEWGNIVERYSQCKLTYGSDKLMAISGIARAIQPSQEANYCAGFFINENCEQKRLVRQLDWYTPSARLEEPAPRRVPSWSWVATDSPVVFRWNEENWQWAEPRPLAEIIRRDVVLEGNDPYGAVSSAKLTIACDMLYVFKPDRFGWVGELSLIDGWKGFHYYTNATVADDKVEDVMAELWMQSEPLFELDYLEKKEDANGRIRYIISLD